uniref:Exosome component 1 n=1 Tax=Cyprinus carpio carpio TaxID=630221 RepID=A0A9J8AWQ8_CYPCA
MSPMKLCVPGERLCSTEDCIPGTGTYLRHGCIFASLAGYVLRKNEGEELPVISVVRETEAQLLPDVGAIVTCKVMSINPRFAKVHILYVGSTPLKDRFRGTIRYELFNLLSTSNSNIRISFICQVCADTHRICCFFKLLSVHTYISDMRTENIFLNNNNVYESGTEDLCTDLCIVFSIYSCINNEICICIYIMLEINIHQMSQIAKLS